MPLLQNDGTGDPAAFSRDVRSWLSGEFDKSYDWAMGDSRAAMGGDVRYAHVPAGPKPCVHCLELAAKGFAYERPPRAENHPGCRCVVVPGTAGTQVEGYDPEGIADRIAKCAETVGIDPKTGDERLRKLIRDEMGRRDPRWIQMGDKAGCKPDYSLLSDGQFRALKQYERDTWDNLALKHGIISTVLPEEDAPANIDATISGKLYELKNPKSGKHAVEDRIREGCGKWERLGLDDSPRIVLSNSESVRDDFDVLNEAIRRCDWYGAEELIFVSRDASWLRRVFFSA